MKRRHTGASRRMRLLADTWKDDDPRVWDVVRQEVYEFTKLVAPSWKESEGYHIKDEEIGFYDLPLRQFIQQARELVPTVQYLSKRVREACFDARDNEDFIEDLREGTEVLKRSTNKTKLLDALRWIFFKLTYHMLWHCGGYSRDRNDEVSIRKAIQYLNVDVKYTWSWDESPEDIYDVCRTRNDIPADAYDYETAEKLRFPIRNVGALKNQVAGNKLSRQCQEWLEVHFAYQWDEETPEEIADAFSGPEYDVYNDIPAEEVVTGKISSLGALKKRILNLA